MLTFSYPKTKNLLARNEATGRLTEELRRSEFGVVGSWLLTEKVDGTNVRLIYTPGSPPEVRGRTDRATLQSDLVAWILERATPERLFDAFNYWLPPDDPGAGTATVFGEGYGPGIQSGGGYSATRRFRIFDVAICWERADGTYGRLWLDWDDVWAVAAILSIPTVPVVRTSSNLAEARVMAGGPSLVSWEEAAGRNWRQAREREGIVARTNPYLFDRYGDRVLWKLKAADL